MPTFAPPDDVFTALAHPARRRLLDLLLAGDLSVKELSGGFELSRPAVSQHLRLLLDTGLVGERRAGRQHLYHLRPERLTEVRDWLDKYQRFWQGRLQQLSRYLDEEQQASTAETEAGGAAAGEEARRREADQAARPPP